MDSMSAVLDLCIGLAARDKWERRGREQVMRIRPASEV